MRQCSILRLTALLLVGSLSPAGRTHADPAVSVSVQLPTVTVAPGGTIDVPITTSVAPAGLGIVAVDYQIGFAANVVQSAQVLGDGWLASLGTPFVNATSTQLGVSMAGAAATTSTLTTLNSLRFVIKASAPIGTDMPLTFTLCRFNEGTPAVTTVDGLIRVRGGLAVPGAGAAALAFATPAPNPAAGATNLSFTLPRALEAQLDVFALDGRLVRRLTRGTLAAGAHSVLWDLRDTSGAAVPPGVYLARLTTQAGTLQRRLVTMR